MARHQFFLPQQVLAKQDDEIFSLELSAKDLHHAHVLRLKPGETITVIDGAQDYFVCEIVAFDDELWVRRCACEAPDESPVEITLCVGLTKGSKMDTILRQATELGIDRFIPYEALRSVSKLHGDRRKSRIERWQTIAHNAAMQAGRLKVPELLPSASLSELSEIVATLDGLLICWEEASAECFMGQALDAVELSRERFSRCSDDFPYKLGLVIGPEGGLDKCEVETFRHAASPSAYVCLGSYILRSETAVLCALSQLIYEISRRREP